MRERAICSFPAERVVVVRLHINRFGINLLHHNDVSRNLRIRNALERIVVQSDSTDKLQSQLLHQLPLDFAFRVHREMRGDEHCNAAITQLFCGLGKEVIVQGQLPAYVSVLSIQHYIFRKRDIGDGNVEVFR